MIAKYMKSYLKQAHNVMPVEGPHPYIIASIEKKNQEIEAAGPCPSLPKPEFLARAANRLRQSARPNDPVNLEFDLNHDHIAPNFLRADIRVRERRHLMFANDMFANDMFATDFDYLLVYMFFVL
jgi:hypothetical protein